MPRFPTSWLRVRPSSRSSSARPRADKRPPCRVALERLEDRVVPTVFGNSQIDGDLQASVNPSPGTYDWDNLNPAAGFMLPKIDTVQNDAFNSSADTQFPGGAKESDPTFTIQLGSSPSKADL